MNPFVAEMDFTEQAKVNIECLTLIDREVFACGPRDTPGAFRLKYPQYWNVNEDGTAPAYVNYPRIVGKGEA